MELPIELTQKLARRGKWTYEEERFTERIIHDFHAGLLNVPPGTTLRSYLSKTLNCDPMRITKKFMGDAAIGKKVFIPLSRNHNHPEEVVAAQAELAELERTWHIKLLEMQREEKRRNSGKYKTATSTSTSPHMSKRSDVESVEEDISSVDLTNDEVRIRNSLRLFTKSESELDDLIIWLRHSVDVINRHQSSNSSPLNATEIDELVRQGDEYVQNMHAQQNLENLQDTNKSIVNYSTSITRPTLTNTTEHGVHSGSNHDVNSGITHVSFPHHPTLSNSSTTAATTNTNTTWKDSYRNTSLNSLDELNASPLPSIQERLLKTTSSTGLCEWINEEDIEDDEECDDGNNNISSMPLQTSVLEQQQAQQQHDSGDKKRVFDSMTFDTDLTNTLFPQERRYSITDDNYLPLRSLNLHSRENSSDNLSTQVPLDSSMHQQPLLSSGGGGGDMSDGSNTSNTSRAYAVQKVIATRPRFLPVRHAHALLDSPFFLDSIRFVEVYGTEGTSIEQVQDSYARNVQLRSSSSSSLAKSRARGINSSVSVATGLDQQYNSSYTSYDTGSAKGLKRIKSEERLGRNNMEAVAVLSGFRSRNFDDQFNDIQLLDNSSIHSSTSHQVLYGEDYNIGGMPWPQQQQQSDNDANTNIITSEQVLMMESRQNRMMSADALADDMSAIDALMGMHRGSFN